MDLFYSKFMNSFKLNNVIKVISGLNTLNINKIHRMLKSAEIAKADYIDVVANTKIISLLSNITDFPLCVSSIDPVELYNCSVAGAKVLEIGNFDIFYNKGINFSSFDILKLAMETRRLVHNECLCVTIPHTLNLYEQILLAKKLEKIGVNFLQTEGISYNTNMSPQYKHDTISKLIYSSASTLSSTYVLSRAVNIPVISSSKINCISSLTSMICGASGIGVKSIIYNKKTVYEMFCCIEEILYSVNLCTKTNDSVKPNLIIGKYNKILPHLKSKQ